MYMEFTPMAAGCQKRVALPRPDRIDCKLCSGEVTKGQKVGLHCRFFPSASETDASLFVGAHSSATTMAEFQGPLSALEQNGTEEKCVAMHQLGKRSR